MMFDTMLKDGAKYTATQRNATQRNATQRN
jgi:hypothetical protein